MGAVADTARSVRWYVTSLMGDRDYQRYVAHRQRQHPGAPVLTEREYWRERMDDMDRNPQSRCC